MVVERAPDIVLKISGDLRSEVADALVERACAIEAEYRGRRRKTKMGEFMLERAAMLRDYQRKILF